MEVLEAIFERDGARPALTDGVGDERLTYGELAERSADARRTLAEAGVPRGAVIALVLDVGVGSIAALLGAIRHGAIVVPIDGRASGVTEHVVSAAQVEWIYRPSAEGAVLVATGAVASHRHYENLRQRDTAGMVLFTSGSSGRSKGVVHDLRALLSKFEAPGKDLKTLLFFRLDHISGIDTLFYSLSNGSELVLVEDRSVDAVCAAVERHRIEVLPTSPSFLRLLLLGEASARFDLDSLTHITFGGEVMPAATLERLADRFPGVRLLQKYGATEFGALAARVGESLWLELGFRGAEVRVVDGVLQVKTPTAMLGYLAGADPFTDDGWLDTRDAVEERDGALRVLGRVSEVINVGGEKVHPARVESVVLELEEVVDAFVFGRENALLGQVVCVRVVPRRPPVDRREMRRLVRRHCRGRLAQHEIPVRVELGVEATIGPRFKRERGRASVG